MAELVEDPDVFRLFVEAWVRSQRDDELSDRVRAGMDAWRETFKSFGRQRVAELGLEPAEGTLEALAHVMLGLAIGLGMVKLTDPEGVPEPLLGAAVVLLLRAVETTEEARAILAAAQNAPRFAS
jgi:hypothetical protein